MKKVKAYKILVFTNLISDKNVESISVIENFEENHPTKKRTKELFSPKKIFPKKFVYAIYKFSP
jgi:hypothetical protein